MLKMVDASSTIFISNTFAFYDTPKDSFTAYCISGHDLLQHDFSGTALFCKRNAVE